MSISRKIIRNKIRNKYGNKSLRTFWRLFQTATLKERLNMMKQFENKKDKKQKVDKKKFEVEYTELKTKIKKSAVVFAEDKKKAKEKVKNMFMSKNKVTKKPIELVKVGKVKEVK